MNAPLTFTLGGLLAGFLALCAGFTTVCVAAGHAVKLWKFRQAPSKELRQELDEIHTALAKHDKLLANDKEALGTLQTEGILSLKAILALLDHSIDGNNIARMESVKDEIKDYLISRH